jgi:hypothetical protein
MTSRRIHTGLKPKKKTVEQAEKETQATKHRQGFQQSSISPFKSALGFIKGERQSHSPKTRHHFHVLHVGFI